MAAPAPDEVDKACEAWAYQWVSLFARDPIKASEYLGRVNCTLGEVRVMADGAASGTVVSQTFPEVFIGDGLFISVLTKKMRADQREMLFRHYADRWYVTRRTKGAHGAVEVIRLGRPVKQQVMAERMQIGLTEYHRRRERLKSFINGFMCAHERRCMNEG